MTDYETPKNEETPRGNVGQTSRKAKQSIARIRAKIKRANGDILTIEGRPAQTILFLNAVGKKGATRLEFTAAGWARSVPSYVYNLRRLGIGIESPLEPTQDGAHVSRYRLIEEIEIIETNIGGKK